MQDGRRVEQHADGHDGKPTGHRDAHTEAVHELAAQVGRRLGGARGVGSAQIVRGDDQPVGAARPSAGLTMTATTAVAAAPSNPSRIPTAATEPLLGSSLTSPTRFPRNPRPDLEVEAC